MRLSKKALGFWLACIPTRLAIAYGLYAGQPTMKRHTWLRMLVSCLLAVVGIAFLMLYVLGWRMSAPESRTPGSTWWNANRPIHGSLYVMAAAYTWNGHKWAWVPALVSTLYGAVSALLEHGEGMNRV